ncbi:MAG: CopK family periplasmic copper-binding protein [Propionivibrio sp.]
MLKKTLVVIALSAVSVLATATEMDARDAAKQVIDMQDGSTVFVFPGGKMALESKYGQAAEATPGSKLTAKDGSTVTLANNDWAYLDTLLKQGAGD